MERFGINGNLLLSRMKESNVRNLLALIGLLVVGGGGAGWYLGWYKLSVTRESDGNLQIKTDVDTTKVNKDATSIFKNVSQAVESQANKATSDAQTSPPNGTPGATPGPVTPPQTPTVEPIDPHGPLPPVPPESPKPPTRTPGTPPNGAIQLIAPK
jgi:hypothetical protein